MVIKFYETNGMKWCNDGIIDIMGLIASLHIETMKNEIGGKTCQLYK